jgi:hypothetical protein
MQKLPFKPKHVKQLSSRKSNLTSGSLQLLFSVQYEKISTSRNKEVGLMAVKAEEEEERVIEQLSMDAELLLKEDDDRKDLKEKRGIIKQTFYDGSNKLKHIIPKGKHL